VESLPEEIAEASKPIGSPTTTSDALAPTIFDHQRGEENELAGTQTTNDPIADDAWEDRPFMVVRIHSKPRTTHFDPTECSDPPPVAVDCIDVVRQMVTDLENEDEKIVDDVWDGTSACRRPLSESWLGEARFPKLWISPPGYHVVDGRLVRKQTTARPPDIWPEMWQAMSKRQREQAISRWSKRAGCHQGCPRSSRYHRRYSWP